MARKSTLIGSTWISAADACERLGVRSQTLYAYVSRGLLHPRRDGRRSTFDTAELDELAARSRRSARPGRLEVLIDTELTLLDPAGRLHYRGVDATTIAGRWSYERTAEWLWSGDDDGEPAPWPVEPPPAVHGVRPADRVRAAMAVLAATAPPRERTLDAGPHIGRRAIQQVIGAVDPVGDDTASTRVATRLWVRLSPLAPTAPRLRALDAALVLLADHELAASTVAARVAASTWAPPLDCVVAGMAAHAGVLHGGISAEVEATMRAGGDLRIGFGHAVYRGDDPRAVALLPLVEAITPARRWRRIEATIAQGEHPNVDLAIAALAVGGDMIAGAAEVVFAVARIAGWLAHAAEEHERPFRFRPRASYRGLAPVDPAVR